MRSSRYWLPAVGFAAAGILLSLFLALEQRRAVEQTEAARLAQAARGVSEALVRRIDGYTEIAFGLRSLFVVDPQTSRKAFNEAVERLGVELRYPGIKNIAFTRYITAGQKAGFEEQVRADRSLEPEGYPGFAVRPPGNRAEYFVADYLWPWPEGRAVHGLDISAQPANLASMQFAKATGAPTASGPFELIQEKTDRTGFVVRVPVFTRPLGTSAISPAESRFVGSVAVTLRVHDLFSSLEREGVLNGLRLSLTDEGSSIPDTPATGIRTLFDNLASAQASMPVHDQALKIYGRNWTLRAQSESSYLSASERLAPLLIGLAGSVIFILLGVGVGLLGRDRSRALAQVAATDAALQESELRWRFAIEGSGDGLWDWNIADNSVFYSARWLEMLGVSASEIGSSSEAWGQRLHPDEREAIIAQVHAHWERKTPQLAIEHRVVCKDGTVKWILGRGLVVRRDAAGQATRMVGTYTDVTQRKLAEAALQQSEGRLAGVIESAMDAIISIDQAHKIILFNTAAENMFGRAAAEMLGQPLDLLLPQALRAVHASHIQGYGANASSARSMGGMGRLTALRANGEEFPIEASISSVGTAQHKIFTVIIRDVTERDQAFADLKESEYFLREAQRAGRIGIYVINLKTGLWRGTDVLDQLLGINAAYLHSVRAWFALMSDETALRVRAHFDAATRDGNRFDIEYQITRPDDGATRWMHGLGDVQYGDNGEALYLSGSLQDITERKDNAAQLQQSLDLLNKLSDQVPGVLFRLQHDKGRGLSLPFASRGLQELFELSPHAVRSDAALVLAKVHPDDLAEFTGSLKHSAVLLQDWNASFRVRLAGQGYRWRMAQARPERLADGATVWHGFVTDITAQLDSEARLREANENLERRVTERTQELLVARDSAEAAKQSRGDFLAKMSHEIRTPLNAVLGMTYLALKGHPDPRQAQYLMKIQGSGEHLLRIINDILDYSKIDAGKLGLEMAVLDIGKMLDQLLQTYEVKADEKGLLVTAEVDPDIPAFLVGDSLRLEQVLINYLANALKFTDQGRICVRARLLALTAAGDNTERCSLRFEVQDTGVGLSAAEIGRLFQSFEQADNSTTRKFGGTGLGLAICKQLAELMGGEVGVTSQVGVGSTFWFTATLSVAESADSVLPDQGNLPQWLAALRDKHVLVVDDNDLNLEVAQGILEEAGMRVTLASNGQQAIDLLLAQRMDCVLMDVHMPVMDGLEATRRIKADTRLTRIPVIAMTANARREDHVKCFDAGMVDAVVKPFTPHKLFEILAHCLASAGGPDAGADGGDVQAVKPDPLRDILNFAVFDRDALSRVIGDNPDFQRKILEKFLKSAQDCRTSLLAAHDSADCAAQADTAHKLKSSARTVGAMRLAQICERMEYAGRRDGMSACEPLMAPLLEGIAVASDAIQGELA